MKKVMIWSAVTVAILVALSTVAHFALHKGHEGHAESAESQAGIEGEAEGGNERCPVMGNAVDKTVHTEYSGRTIHFCCDSCIETFNADPERYLNKLGARQGR